MKLAFITGARPQFIKIAPFIHLLESSDDFEYYHVHTGQHYDYKMSSVFFDDLELPQPDYFFELEKNASHAIQTAEIMKAFEETGYDGAISPEHALRIAGDAEDRRQYWAYAIGHMRGLLQGLDLTI